MKSMIYMTLMTVVLTSCCGQKKVAETTSDKVNSPREISFEPGPQTVIYKTTHNFSQLVPVLMDAAKTRIVSYPAPADIYYNGEFAKPTALKNGYWLDNRGINENVVFLDYTYEEYSQFEQVPSIEMLKDRIAERYPLTEMYKCGVRTQYENEVEELNALIDDNFAGCKKVKIKALIAPPIE